MLLSISDTETTGLDPNKESIIEIAVILYSTTYRCIVEQYSTLIPREYNSAEFANNISAFSTRQANPNFLLLQSLIDRSDYTIFHNAKFDVGFINNFSKLDLTKPVICSMDQIRFSKSRPKTKKLTEIAIEHDIPVWKPHRALTDCSLLANIFSTYSTEELESLILDAVSDKYLYVSLEPVPGALSKEAGFSFNKDVFKRWSKYITERESNNFPFKVVKVEPEKMLSSKT